MWVVARSGQDSAQGTGHRAVGCRGEGPSIEVLEVFRRQDHTRPDPQHRCNQMSVLLSVMLKASTLVHALVKPQATQRDWRWVPLWVRLESMWELPSVIPMVMPSLSLSSLQLTSPSMWPWLFVS